MAGLNWLRNRYVQIAMGGLGLALILAGYGLAMRQIGRDPHWPANTDFGLYRRAGDLLAAGQSPYRFAPDQEFRYVYPPLLADLVALFDRAFGLRVVAILWPTAVAASFLAGAAMALRGFSDRASWAVTLLVCGVFMVGRTTQSDIYHGQINELILLLLVGGLQAARSGRSRVAAVCWAVIIVFKPFLGVLVFYLLWKRQGRLALLTLGASAVLFLASFAPVGIGAAQAVAEWMSTSRFASSPSFGALPDNQSVYGLLIRMTTPNPYVTPWVLAPGAPGILLIGLYVAGAAATSLWIARDGWPSGDRSPLSPGDAVSVLEFQIPLALFMGCGPLTEGDHVYFVFPAAVAAALIWLRRMADGAPGRLAWGVAALLWMSIFLAAVSPVRLPISFSTEHSWALMRGPGVLLSGRIGLTLLAAAALSARLLEIERLRDRPSGA